MCVRVRIKVWNSCVVVDDGVSPHCPCFSHRPDNPDNRADALTVAFLVRDIASDAGDDVTLDFLN